MSYCRTISHIAVGFLVMSVLMTCSQESSESSVAVVEPVMIPSENGPPDLSGIWQALGSAGWDLEGHTASKMPVTRVIGAHGGIPAGTSVVIGGDIPYLPNALETRNANRAD